MSRFTTTCLPIIWTVADISSHTSDVPRNEISCRSDRPLRGNRTGVTKHVRCNVAFPTTSKKRALTKKPWDGTPAKHALTSRLGIVLSKFQSLAMLSYAKATSTNSFDTRHASAQLHWDTAIHPTLYKETSIWKCRHNCNKTCTHR